MNTERILEPNYSPTEESANPEVHTPKGEPDILFDGEVDDHTRPEAHELKPNCSPKEESINLPVHTVKSEPVILFDAEVDVHTRPESHELKPDYSLNEGSTNPEVHPIQTAQDIPFTAEIDVQTRPEADELQPNYSSREESTNSQLDTVKAGPVILSDAEVDLQTRPVPDKLKYARCGSEGEVEMALEDIRSLNSEDSDSDDTASTASSIQLSDGICLPNNFGATMGDDVYDEDGEREPILSRAFSTKNEIVEPAVLPPPIEEIDLSEPIEAIGTISSIIESVIIIQGFARANTQSKDVERVLDSDSLMVFDDRKVLGQIFETFGPTNQPMYSVRFPSAEDINIDQVFVGRQIFHAPQKSTYVFPRALALLKGSDASNVHDEEPAADEIEFSDDEDERAARKRHRGKFQDRGEGSSHVDRWKRQDEGPAPSETLPYDDDGDPYAIDTTSAKPVETAGAGDPYLSQATSAGSNPDSLPQRRGEDNRRPRDASELSHSRTRRTARGRGFHWQGSSRPGNLYRENYEGSDRMRASDRYRQNSANADAFPAPPYPPPLMPPVSPHNDNWSYASSSQLTGFGENYVAPHVNPRFAAAYAMDNTYMMFQPYLNGYGQFYPHQQEGFNPQQQYGYNESYHQTDGRQY